MPFTNLLDLLLFKFKNKIYVKFFDKLMYIKQLPEWGFNRILYIFNRYILMLYRPGWRAPPKPAKDYFCKYFRIRINPH
ncbi:hypothetical protein DFR30_1425 [Thiogranum longum]|uniref:Uncharacterized protein n=1 Tax=Thiogranum longum TaxID=1537524 RepID=A0A4R1H8J4_9GAMM|nr:hypothetical protein DFR30_1425 [Thiogranum longum]